jgi:hypothetical protein
MWRRLERAAERGIFYGRKRNGGDEVVGVRLPAAFRVQTPRVQRARCTSWAGPYSRCGASSAVRSRANRWAKTPVGSRDSQTGCPARPGLGPSEAWPVLGPTR